MAVGARSAPPQFLRDFWPRYRREASLVIVGGQIVTASIIGGALSFGDVMSASTITFWILIFSTFIGATGINLLIFSLLSEPTKNLADALTHASGEPTTVTPPNPNAKRYSKSGMKLLLQTIYEQAANQGPSKPQHTSKSSLDVALSEITTGIIVLDKDKRLTYYNRAAPVYSDANGRQIVELIFDEQDTLTQWLETREERDVHAERTWRRIPNKIAGEADRRFFDISVQYHRGSEAETVIVLFDRTADYAPEEDELDFIAFAAHELRGPITVIRGYLDVLGDELEPVLASDQKELIGRLVVSANRLSSYINNILNSSRYDRRHLKVHLHEDTVAGIYSTISDDMDLRAHSQNRLLSASFPDDLPTVAADRTSISEVMSNLIDNAIKYSNEGGMINVTARVVNDFVEVSVTDHGIGMPSNVVSNLFQKFYRSHRSRETVSGSGIGLYISKAIVESHGGKVSVSSIEGEGSTFTFAVPVYITVADKLSANNSTNEGLIEHGSGWIKNHSMYRG